MAQEYNVAQVAATFKANGLAQLNTQIDTLGKKTTNIKGLLTSLGGAYMLKGLVSSFFQASRQLEDYRTSIRAVSRTITEADATFNRIKEWAELNPVNTDEAVSAFVRLRTASVANAESAMTQIADLSTVMHRSMEDVAAALVTTNSRMLRSLGIQVSRANGQATVSFGEASKTVKGDLNSVRAAILDVIGQAIPNAMQSARDTVSGSLKTMSGMWSKFQTDVMGFGKEGGIFGGLSASLNQFRDAWQAWMDSAAYEKFLQNVSNAANGVANLISTLWQHKDAIGSVIVGLVAYKTTLAAVNIAQAIFRSNIAAWLSLLPTALSSLHNFSTFMTMLGGSVSAVSAAAGGLAILLGGYYISRMQRAAYETKVSADAIQGLNDKFKNASTEKINAEIKQLEAHLVELRIKAIDARKELLKQFEDSDTSGWVAGMKLKSGKSDEMLKTEAQIAELKKLLKTRAEIEKAEKDAARSAVNSTGTGTGTGTKGKSETEKLIERIDMQVKYAGADIAKAKNELETLLNSGKIKPFSEDWKKLADKVKEYDGTLRSISDSNYELGITTGTTTAAQALTHYIDELKKGKSAAGAYATEQEKVSRLSQNTGKVMSSLQNVISEINDNYDKHNISLSEATQTLQNWGTALSDIPAAVNLINDEMRKFDTTRISNMTENIMFDVKNGALSAQSALEVLRIEFNKLSAAEGASMSNPAAWSNNLKTVYSSLEEISGQIVEPALERINRRFENGLMTLPEYIAQLEQLKGKYSNIAEVVNRISEAQRTAQETATSFGTRMEAAIGNATKAVNELDSTALTGLADGFARAISYGDDLGDSMKKLAQDIAYTVTKMLMLKAVTSMFGGLFGGIGGGGNVYSASDMGWMTLEGMGRHTGGIAGIDTPTFTRMLPKFHTGGIVGSKEELAILKKGEGVFTEGQMKAIGRGIDSQSKGDGGVTIGSVIMNVRADDAESFKARMANNSAIIESVVIKNIMGNGTVRGAIRTALA